MAIYPRSTVAELVFLPIVFPTAPAPPNKQTVPSVAVVLDLNKQVFWPLQTFVWDGITTCTTADENQALTWLTWVPANSTWLQIPYFSWLTIPSLAETVMYIGTLSGFVMNFFTSGTDNGGSIAYSATWPLICMPDMTQNLKVSWVEYYFQQMPFGPGSGQLSLNEAMEVDLFGLLTPLDPKPLQLSNLAVQLSDSTTWFAPILPGPLNPANIPVNWLQVTMQGAGNANTNNFVCVGGTIYANVDQKPDYQSSAGVPAR